MKQRRPNTFVRLLPAVGAGALLAFGEAMLVLSTRSELFLSMREFVRFWGIVTCVAISLQVLLAALAGTIGQLIARLFRGRFAWGVALVAGVCCVPASAWLFWALTNGRSVRDWNYRPFAVSAAVVITSLSVMGFATVLSQVRLSARLPGLRRALFWFLLLAAAGCLVADATLLYRLYPPFHWALAVLAVLSAASAAQLWPFAPPASRFAAQLGGALGLLAGLVGPFLLRSTNDAPNLRYAIDQAAPLTGKLLRIVRSPQRRTSTALAAASRAADKRPAQPGISLRGQDILLITIDALRADRLRTYGSHQDLTPNLDRLAADAAVFERAYTPTPHTSYAIGSMLTGKYLRPVLSLPGAPRDHTTLPRIVRRFGYRTAAFYPPAVFFVDEERFGALSADHFGFEYVKEMFASGPARVVQLQSYLEQAPAGHPLFVWVHLFEPHEPYEPAPGFDRGSTPELKYDAEVAAADAAAGELIRVFRARSPQATVIISADHGEEFGDHGGLHHGTTLFDEQVRVPLIWSSPGQVRARRIEAPAQLVDLAPTLLAALSIPRDPRMRGSDLSALLNGAPDDHQLRAFASIEELRMWTDGQHKLICESSEGSCRLYDLRKDPRELRDATPEQPEVAQRMAAELSQLVASIPEAEVLAMQSGDAWPKALARARLGDMAAREELLPLLADNRPAVVAETLRAIAQLRVVAAQELVVALADDSTDEHVRDEAALCALSLGATTWHDRVLARVKRIDLQRISSREALDWPRRAAFALQPSSEPQVVQILVGLAADSGATAMERERALAALGRAGATDAVPAIIPLLEDVRVRPAAARALGALGGPRAVKALFKALSNERYPEARAAEVEALVALRIRKVTPQIVRFLGTDSGLPGGLEQWARLRGPRAGGALIDLRHGTKPAGLRGDWTCRATMTSDGPPGCRPGPGRADVTMAGRLAQGDARLVAVAWASGNDEWIQLGDREFELRRGRNEVALTLSGRGHNSLGVRASGNSYLELIGVVKRSPDVPPPPPQPVALASESAPHL